MNIVKINNMAEQIKPTYYQYQFPDGKVWDVIDIARAMNLPFTLALALKYFRKKGDVDKEIEDLKKAIECLEREIDYLQKQVKTYGDDLPF